MNLTKNIARAAVFSLALATVPASAFTMPEFMTSAWTKTTTNAGLAWEYMTPTNIFALSLASALAYTALKKPQEPQNIQHHDSLVLELVDNIICGQNEKEVGLKEIVDVNGNKILKKHKIEPTGLLGNSLAMVKPLAYAGAAFYLVKSLLGFELPEFAEKVTNKIGDAASALKTA